MTVPEPEVSPWNVGRLRSFRPEMDLLVDTPAASALGAVETGLRRASYHVRRRTPVGFRARHYDWWSFTALQPSWTTLHVEASPAGALTRVTVRVRLEGSQRVGRRHAVRGLTLAVTALRTAGHRVEVSPWRAAPRRARR